MNIERYLDSTLLKADATNGDIKELCSDAIKYNMKAVCVNPCYVKMCKDILNNTDTSVATVIGFPLGANTIYTKVNEAYDAIMSGADEIDMVINVGALKNKNYEYIKKEIDMVKSAIDNHILKVIIETCYLDDDEIRKMTEICNNSEVDFIKTSTSFGTRGVSYHDIEVINDARNERLQIKASGGVREIEVAKQYIKMGVTRIGTSNAKKIIEEDR